MENQPCPFCDKLAQLTAARDGEVVWQFHHSVALLGPWQYYQGYCILVARRHATELHQLSLAERHAYFEEMCTLAIAIETAFRPRKLNYELLGNQVPHLHWHLFPRHHEDPDVLQPVWLALARADTDAPWRQRMQRPGAAATTASRIREALLALGEVQALDGGNLPVY